MRRCLIRVLVVMAASLALVSGTAWAASPALSEWGQGAPVLPPTIISFAVDVEEITLADAEAGETPARLTWQTVGVQTDQRLMLYAYRVNRWEPLLPPDAEPLPGTGGYDFTIQHALTFSPPMISLVIVDAAGQTLDQRIVIIPYAPPDPAVPLNIDLFHSGVTELDAAALASGAARVPVTWEVSGRQLHMHLVFEQVMESGSVVSVELPRPNLWILRAAKVLAPAAHCKWAVGAAAAARVVDIRDGNTLAAYALPPLPVVQGASAPAAPLSPPAQGGTSPGSSQGRSPAPVEVALFVVTPETIPRGGLVTVSWDVRNAAEVGIWLVEPGGRLAQFAPDRLHRDSDGCCAVLLCGRATFMLFASDAAGDQAGDSGADVIAPMCISSIRARR